MQRSGIAVLAALIFPVLASSAEWRVEMQYLVCRSKKKCVLLGSKIPKGYRVVGSITLRAKNNEPFEVETTSKKRTLCLNGILTEKKKELVLEVEIYKEVKTEIGFSAYRNYTSFSTSKDRDLGKIFYYGGFETTEVRNGKAKTIRFGYFLKITKHKNSR